MVFNVSFNKEEDAVVDLYHESNRNFNKDAIRYLRSMGVMGTITILTSVQEPMPEGPFHYGWTMRIS